MLIGRGRDIQHDDYLISSIRDLLPRGNQDFAGKTETRRIPSRQKK
jgi:hypothetical protein